MSQLNEVMRQARESVEARWNELLQNPSNEFIKFVRSEIGISEKGMDSLIKQVILDTPASAPTRVSVQAPTPVSNEALEGFSTDDHSSAEGMTGGLRVQIGDKEYVSDSTRDRSAANVLTQILADILEMPEFRHTDLAAVSGQALIYAIKKKNAFWVVSDSDLARMPSRLQEDYRRIGSTKYSVHVYSSHKVKGTKLKQFVTELGISQVQIWANGRRV